MFRLNHVSTVAMSASEPKSGRIRSDPDQRTAYRFTILAARQTRCIAEMYTQEFGLAVSQWKILVIIGNYAPMSAKDVAERTSLQPEKVTRAVDKLVAHDFVIRRKDPSDRRRVILSLSANGRSVYRRSERIRGTIEREFLETLRPVERTMFYRILDKLERRAAEIFSGKHAWRRIVDRRNSSGARGRSGNSRRSPKMQRNGRAI